MTRDAAEDRPAPSPRPGPEAQDVARPRMLLLPIWALLLVVGATFLAGGFSGDGVGLAILGVVWTAGSLLGLFAVLWFRVQVDGRHLHVRRLRGWVPPLDLDRLENAWFETTNHARSLRLEDLDGRSVRIDALNQRIVPLYLELAARYDRTDVVLSDVDLQRALERHDA